MALVLNYVNMSETRSGTRMYPFLPPVMSHVATHKHESGATRGLGLDGTDENQETTSDLCPVADRYHSPDLNEPLVAGVSTHVDSKQHFVDAENADIDPNQSRRKRQKLTPVKEKPASGKSKLIKPNKITRGTIQWFSQPKGLDPHSKVDGISDSVDPSSSTDGVNPGVSTQDTSSTTIVRTPHALQAGNGNVPILQTRSGRHDRESPNRQIQQTPARSKGATPKKKTISLHTNGTLLSSPRISPRLIQKTAEVVRQPDSGRNVKVRNGKLVQSLPVVIKYGANDASRQILSKRIDEILVSKTLAPHATTVDQTSKTHPFFLGKAVLKPAKATDTGNDHSDEGKDQEDSGLARPTAPVAWKDIKFSSSKVAGNKTVDLVRPIWPPRDMQHVGNEHSETNDPRANFDPTDATDTKRKTRTISLDNREDILNNYERMLKGSTAVPDQTLAVQRHIVSGATVSSMLDSTQKMVEQYPAISNLHIKLKSGTSAFDRGEAGGQNIWSSKYAPSGWIEVLQPSCNILHNWLQSLAVHNVKVGVDKDKPRGKEKTNRKKKRQSKVKDELSDFIVDGDDEDDAGSKISNAILITGPSGCGKTASVFAVAKELGFEIFEIHAGMRRSAKDIFDKVGDMTQNHLVQRGEGGSRSSSMPPSDTDVFTQTVGGQAQPTMSTFLGSKKNTKQARPPDIEATTAKKEQKQSLILFEEVDILFEEDRGFWTGVQSLIQHSKRPVVMTCNDISTIPVDELGLHTILEFTPPSNPVATEYLTYLAAAEGHIIDRTALSTLYASKRCDLRASITELNLWCQMTIGSKFGGLDWMLQSVNGQPQTNSKGERLRIFSQGTYRTGVDLFPQTAFEEEDNLRFLQTQLDFTLTDWYNYAGIASHQRIPSSTMELQQSLDVADAWSVLDIIDDQAAPILAATLIEQYHDVTMVGDCGKVASLYVERLNRRVTKVQDLVNALEPVMEEKPIFPPSQGRLAPSLDNASPSVATDVTPYVRSIVSFDQRLEQYREEAFGSQGKKIRNTRAARAAAEGRDKANTRTERWLPQALDFDQVMQTGASWPQWVGDYMPGSDSDMALSQSTVGE